MGGFIEGTGTDSQNPISTDGASVFAKDVWIEESDIGDFSGSITDLFDNLHSTITDTTVNNPKEIFIHFNRTVVSNAIGFGATGGDFSNVEIQIANSGGIFTTVVDESAIDTKYTSRTFQLPIFAGFNAIKIIFHTVDQVSLSNVVVLKTTTTVSRLQAVKEDGTVTDIGATNNNNLKVSVQENGDTPAIDAFDRMRVSETFTIFDSKQLHDKQPLFWDEIVTGSATSVHEPTNAATNMTVTASAGDSVQRQTKQRFNYQPGKSQLVFMTFQATQAAGVTNRIGLFDGIGAGNLTPGNGIFFECNGALSWNIAKDGTIAEAIAQDNWNVDKLDGTGVSGITLDMESAHILIMDYEWLGVGRVRVGFVIDGLIFYCHYFNHANDPAFPSVYMSTPNLPLRYSIETDGSTESSLNHICGTVISEGGVDKTGVLRVADTGTSFITSLATGTSYAIIGIKLKDLYKDITVIPEGLSVIAGSNDSFKWELHVNPVINGTFTYNDLLNSSIQNAIGTIANTVAANGLIISSGYGSTATRQTDAALNTALRIGSTIAGVQDELVLVVIPLSANLSIAGALNFRELI